MPDKEVHGLSEGYDNRNDKENADNAPEKEGNPITREELIEQLDLQISYFDRLPQHEKFSFCTNADLCYFMMLIANIVKKVADDVFKKRGA